VYLATVVDLCGRELIGCVSLQSSGCLLLTYINHETVLRPSGPANRDMPIVLLCTR